MLNAEPEAAESIVNDWISRRSELLSTSKRGVIIVGDGGAVEMLRV
jgi:hypothetical protein